MVFDKLIKLNQLYSDIAMCNRVIAVLKRLKNKEKIEYYYKKYPIYSWLSQKWYYYNWNK